MTQLPPHNAQAEEAVLGSIIVDPDAVIEVEPMLEPAAFYIGRHRTVYEAILEMHRNDRAIDVITLSDTMPDEPNILDFLLDLIIRNPTSTNATGYSKIVATHHKRRQFIRTAGEIAGLSHDLEKPIEEVQAVMERALIEVNESPASDRPIRHDMMELLEVTEQRVELGRDVVGLKTGLTDVDKMLSGLMKGSLYITAARPGMGKSAMESCWALNIAGKGGKVLRVNLEMTRLGLTTRLASAMSHVPYENIQTGRFQNGQHEKFNQAVGAISEMPMWIRTPRGTKATIEAIASDARRLHYRYGLDVLFLDYLQLMEVTGGYGNRVQDVGILSRGLKNIALELDIPVVAASQLSRSCESRADKRPMLSDLRDSGNIEQDADVVMFIYRDDYYNKQSDRPGIAELNISKHRNGRTGTVDLYFNGPLMRFDNFTDTRMDDIGRGEIAF